MVPNPSALKVILNRTKAPALIPTFRSMPTSAPQLPRQRAPSRGNSSQMSDGAAAAVVMSADRANSLDPAPSPLRRLCHRMATSPKKKWDLAGLRHSQSAQKLPGLRLEGHRWCSNSTSLRGAIPRRHQGGRDLIQTTSIPTAAPSPSAIPSADHGAKTYRPLFYANCNRRKARYGMVTM